MSTFYLPPELWLNVIQSMCYHCTRDPHQPSPVPDHRLDPELPNLAPLATLARLCRVSKQLQGIATPLLYHCPITTRPELLVRTIFDRSDLVGYILEMHHNMWQNWPLDLASYPRGFRDAYCVKICRLIGEDDECLDEADSKAYDNSLTYDRIETHVRDTVVLEQLSCVKAISLKTTKRPVCKGIDPDALQDLKFASITNIEDSNIFITDMQTGSRLHMIAPGITSMHYFQAVVDDDCGDFPGSPEVTTLELQECSISGSALPRILVSNPALTTFAYSDGGVFSDQQVICATLREIQDALVVHNPRLKKLHTDMADTDCSYWTREWPFSFNQSLAKLAHLIHLSADYGCLTAGAGQTLSEYLVTILPASLQYLRIRLDMDMEEEPEIEEDLRQALTAVARLRPAVLPAMEKIVIWDKHLSPKTKPYSDWDCVREAWQRTGVVFEVTDVEGLFGCRWS